MIAPGVDTRGEGGYVIVPPSTNGAGRYEVVTGDELYLIDWSKLPPFPSDLLNKIGARYTGWGGDTPTADPQLIAAAMAVIPNPDLGWEDWKKFAMAILALHRRQRRRFRNLRRVVAEVRQVRRRQHRKDVGGKSHARHQRA